MGTPYKLNPKAIEEFKAYHGLKNDDEVAKLFCMSPSYLSLLLAGRRKLNEEIRLRIQFVTRKPQDQLFLPDYQEVPFTHQSMAMGKFYGIFPYDQFSVTKEFRDLELETMNDSDFNRNRMRRIVAYSFKCELCNDTFPEQSLKAWHENGNAKDNRFINLRVLCEPCYDKCCQAKRDKKPNDFIASEIDRKSKNIRKHFHWKTKNTANLYK